MRSTHLTTQPRGATEVMAVLRQDIAAAKYLYEERLPSERDLSEAFGVARGTLRAAIKQLEGLGYVERRAGSGTYVTFKEHESSSEARVFARPLELIDARFALEPHICRLAALHAKDHDLDAVDRILERMEECNGDVTVFGQLDEAFHHLLARLTRNSLLECMTQKITDARSNAQWAQMRSLTLNPEMIGAYNRQHRMIVGAIRNRNPERAAQCMKDHLAAARDSLMRNSQT